MIYSPQRHREQPPSLYKLWRAKQIYIFFAKSGDSDLAKDAQPYPSALLRINGQLGFRLKFIPK